VAIACTGAAAAAGGAPATAAAGAGDAGGVPAEPDAGGVAPPAPDPAGDGFGPFTAGWWASIGVMTPETSLTNGIRLPVLGTK